MDRPGSLRETRGEAPGPGGSGSLDPVERLERVVQARLDAGLESASAAAPGVFRTGTNARLLYANGAMARMLGYDSPEQLMKDSPRLPPLRVDRGRREELVRVMEADGAVQGFRAHLHRRDGRVAWVRASVRAVREPSGELVGFAGVLADPSEARLPAEGSGR